MTDSQFFYSQKNNFSGGELTPTIEGRTELGLYQNGVKKLINFMLLPSGGIMRRHGTKFVHLFEDNVPKKMVSVMFSRKLSYLLVFESHKTKTICSFFVDGELYLTSKVLKDQGQDFHFWPKEFSCVTFQGIAYISFGTSRPIFKFSVDPEIVERFYGFLKEERARAQEEHDEQVAVAAGRAMENVSNFPEKDRLFIIEPLHCHVNYFKQEGSNTLKPKIKPFNEVIYNAEVDHINDELKAIHGSGRDVHEERAQKLYCHSVVTFENRLWCFGAGHNIHSIWASYKGDFADFRMAYKSLLEARNPLTAFSATFSSSTFDNVLWSVPFGGELLLGTTDGIYLVKEGDRSKGEFIKIHREIELPVSPIKPVVLGKTIFFVEGNGRKINSLFYSQEKGGFQIADITAYAEHIFAAGIREITGSNSPFSIVFAVLKNGSFASFTYSHDLKIMGWSQHWLGGNGEVLGITPIYADNEDRLYFWVRRPNTAGSGYKEYLEVLQTRYFSAGKFETQRLVYADCHINSGSLTEYTIARAVEGSISDDSAHHMRGSITKLEQIIQTQAEHILRLNLEQIDMGESFKFRGKLLKEYGEEREDITTFLRNYYQNYFPIIMRVLGLCFAYHRIFSRIYDECLNLFSGELDVMSKIEALLHDGERVGGDIIELIEGEVAGWQISPIMQGMGSAGLVEYLPNSAFNFHPSICGKIKGLNTEAIRIITDRAGQIIAYTKGVMEQQFEIRRELGEMITSVAKLNRRLLSYYSGKDAGAGKGLLKNLEQFFTKSSIDFYSELFDISHPNLTQYLFSGEALELVTQRTVGFTNQSTKTELKDAVSNLIRQLIRNMEQRYDSRKQDEITSFKRREEIVELLRSGIITNNNLNEETQEYVLSAELKAYVDELVDRYEFGDLGSRSVDDSSVGMGADSESDEGERVASKVNRLIQTLREALRLWQQSLVDFCAPIIPQTHHVLLKDIVENENAISFEKYLLLSKKHYPLFKKLFPDIGDYELSVIARNCLPATDQIKLEGILPIFEKMEVAIIGDEELQSTQILNSETIKLKLPARYLSIGFPYKSVMQTFPLIFNDEIEHTPKMDVEVGLKLFNTKGGFLQAESNNGEIEQHALISRHINSDDLIRFTSEKKYLAAKEVCNVLSRPYLSGWSKFTLTGNMRTDIGVTFIADKPHPASILKIFAKAKVLAWYKG